MITVFQINTCQKIKQFVLDRDNINAYQFEIYNCFFFLRITIYPSISILDSNHSFHFFWYDNSVQKSTNLLWIETYLFISCNSFCSNINNNHLRMLHAIFKFSVFNEKKTLNVRLSCLLVLMK